MKVRSGKKNPTYNKRVDLYLSGKCESVKFAAKGGRSIIYDFSDQGDRNLIKPLIAKPLTGCSWSSFSRKVVPTATSPHGRKGKVLTKDKGSQKKTPSNAATGATKPSKKPRNCGKSYVKGFTTESNVEPIEAVHNPLKKKLS